MADFSTWMSKVNSTIESISGVSADDLADQCWYDWYEDGLTPNQAARLCLQDVGF